MQTDYSKNPDKIADDPSAGQDGVYVILERCGFKAILLVLVVGRAEDNPNDNTVNYRVITDDIQDDPSADQDSLNEIPE